MAQTYDDWACPVCETLNEAERDDCRACSYTVEETADERHLLRWTRAALVGSVTLVVGIAILFVGVQTVESSLVAAPVIGGITVASLGVNLAVDSLDW